MNEMGVLFLVFPSAVLAVIVTVLTNGDWIVFGDLTTDIYALIVMGCALYGLFKNAKTD